MAGGESRLMILRRAVKRIGFTRLPCASSRVIIPCHNPHTPKTNNSSSGSVPRKPATIAEATAEDADPLHAQTKQLQEQQQSMCAICLEPLASFSGEGSRYGGGRQAIFTAQCMHSFHFVCISSAVRHGGVTCPICRARWAQLPFNLTSPSPATSRQWETPSSPSSMTSSPTSPATTSPLYDDDDPIPVPMPACPRLHLFLTPFSTSPPGTRPPKLRQRRHPMLMHHPHFVGPSSSLSQQQGAILHTTQKNRLWLSSRLSHQQATDVVAVVGNNGPHVQLLRQYLALMVFSLRPIDRLAIITYSTTTATRALPLRRMTSHGKLAALQVIDRIHYLSEADPINGLKKGAKVLEDRSYQNPLSCILHLTSSPTRACAGHILQVPFPVHCYNFGFNASCEFAMHEFKEFLSRLLRGVIREIQLRIGEERSLVKLGELRGGEERRILLALAGDCGFLRVSYSYIEGGVEETLQTGETVVEIAQECEGSWQGWKLQGGI